MVYVCNPKLFGANFIQNPIGYEFDGRQGALENFEKWNQSKQNRFTAYKNTGNCFCFCI